MLGFRPAPRRVALAVLGLVGAPVLALGIIYGGLQTDAGRRLAVPPIERAVGWALDTEAGIERLAEASLSRLRIEGLSLGGREPWLSATVIDATWRAPALLAGHLSISALAIDRLTLHRPPPSDDTPWSETLEDLRLPVDVGIGRLSIATLALDAAVLGEAAALAVDGAATGRGDGSGILRLDVARLDGPGGRLEARVDYALDSRRLDLGLSLAEPENGVLARLLDLPGHPAVSATLAGAGTLDGWQGRLRAAADGLMALDATLDLALGVRLGVTLDGTADVAAVLPETLRGLAASALEFRIEADWDVAGEGAHGLTARLGGDAAEAVLDATVDGRALDADGRLVVRLRDPGVLAALTAPATARAAEATVTFGGPLTRPAGRLDGRLDGLVLPGAVAERAVVAAEYALAEGFGGPVALTGSLRLTGLTVESAALAGLAGGEASAEFHGRVLAGGDVEMTAARLRAAAGEASLSGFVTADGAVDVAGSLEVPDLVRLQHLVGMRLGGTALVTAALRMADGGVGGTIAADFRRLALPDAGPAAGLLGPEVALALDVGKEAGGGWRFDAISLDGSALSAAGRAVFDADFSRYEADYRVRLPDLSALAAAGGVAVAGGATLQGTTGGATAAPWVRGHLAADGLGIEGRPWRDLRLDYRLDDLVAGPRGRLDARARSPWAAVTLGADIGPADGGRLAVRNLAAEALGTRLTGTITVDAARALVDGRLEATVPDLTAWSAAAGIPLAGGLGATLVLVPGDGRQDIALALDARDLRVAPDDGAALTVDGLTARLRVGDILGERRIDGQVRLAGLARRDLRLETVEAGVRGRSARLDVSLAAAGPSLAVDGAGAVALADDAVEVFLDALSGQVLGQPFALAGPARVRHGGGGLAVAGLDLRIGEGAVRADLRLDRDAVDLTARLHGLPLALVALALPGPAPAGTADGEVRIAGPVAAPDGRLRLETRDAALAVAGERMAVDARVEGTLQGGALALVAGIEGPGGALLAFDGRLPVRVSAAAPAIVADGQGAVAATVRGRGELAVLLGPLLPDPHRLGGRLDLAAEVSGRLSAPHASGALRIDGGRYEHLVVGTLIRDIQLEARLDGDRLDVVRASGLAGDGRIEGSGSLGLSPADGFPLDIALRAAGADLVRRDDVSAMASGEVAITGPARGPAVRGRIAVDEAEVRLVDRMPPEVVTLDVVEINGPYRSDVEQAVAGRPGPGVTLDLTVAIPNRLFVRGQGLESEWSGAFRLAGSADSPRVEGEVKPVRGQVSFAGKTFVLQPASSVAFRDPTSTIPVLDVTAEYRGRDFVARVLIRGPADSPELALSSVPDLPQDEIVSRVLFGRGVARISAIEAAQLAQTVASLSGRGGLDVLETARRMLGVDVLRVEAGEGEGGPAVTAGRYLARDVYVGISQGAGAASGEATVEVELTPNVILETEIGPTSGGQIGARWKRDY